MLNEYEKWYQMVEMKIITIMTVITFFTGLCFPFQLLLSMSLEKKNNIYFLLVL